MRVNIEFLAFPMVSEVVGKNKLELNFRGETVKDVICELIERHGEKVRDAFYDAKGNFDSMVVMSLNGKSFIPPDKHDTLLKDGDNLKFIIMLDGG